MTNEELVDDLCRSGVLRSPQLISAFRQIDRRDFVRREDWPEAYADYPLPIGFGQTISQPTTVALMLELLQPSVGEKILDVGAGSGWTTALLAQVVGERGRVIGLELVAELVKFGTGNLKQYHFPHAEIRQASKQLGLPDEAPFDRILVSAAATTIPPDLVDQLRINGRLVLPVGNSLLRLDKNTDGTTDIAEFPGFVFVPLK